MTLNTRVAIVQEIDPQAAFRLALDAICIAAGEADRIATAQVRGPSVHENGTASVGTVLGQGLPGIVDCDYRIGGPLHAEDYYDRTYLDPGETATLDTPACWVEIGWDTAYSFAGANGIGCSDLHSIAITLVHKALAERGIDIHWYNEYDSTWNSGIEKLDTLSAAGLEADLWFRHTAMPAIAAHIALGGER